MKRVYWLTGGAGAIGAAMIAVAILSPTTPKRLMSDCETVTLAEDCLGHPPGTVLGYNCVSPLRREFTVSDEAMYGTAAAVVRAGCMVSTDFPNLASGAPSPAERFAIQKYSDSVCKIKDPDMRHAEIMKARQKYRFEVTCRIDRDGRAI